MQTTALAIYFWKFAYFLEGKGAMQTEEQIKEYRRQYYQRIKDTPEYKVKMKLQNMLGRAERRSWFPSEPLKSRKEAIAWVAQLREDNDCVLCEEAYPAALSFHHVHPYTKIDSISQMVRTGDWWLVEEEVKKCVLLCERCHRKLKRHGRTPRRKVIQPEISWGEEMIVAATKSKSKMWYKTRKGKEWLKKHSQKQNRLFYEKTNKIKAEQGCKICNDHDPVGLDFHHRNPKEKKYCVSLMIGCAWRMVEEEIAKCNVLCAVCHRKLEDMKRRLKRVLGKGSPIDPEFEAHLVLQILEKKTA